MPEPTTGKPNGASSGISRDALLAEITNLPKVETAKVEPEAPKPTETPAEKPVEPETETEKADPEPEPEPAKEPEPKPDEIDASTQRGIDKVRREEKRAREALALEKLEWKREREREQSHLAPRLSELEKFEALKARAKYDPVAVLGALGISEDDFDAVSRAVYAASKGAKSDPKNKAAAEAMMRDREAADRVATLEKKLAERDERDKQREQHETVMRQVNTYLDGVTKAVTDEHPLTKAFLAKKPADARRALHEIAVEITDPDNDDDAPTPSDVLAAYEKRRQAELEDLGVDWRVTAKNANTPPVKPSKTLGGAGSGATQSKKPTRDPKERDAEIRRALLEDKLE